MSSEIEGRKATGRVAFRTLGCKLNFSETSTMARNLRQNGYERVDFSQEADVYVINTCSVTERADTKCRKVIRQAMRQSPHALVAVVGCYAQLKAEEIAKIPGVDLVLGADEKFNLAGYLDLYRKAGAGQIHLSDVEGQQTFAPSFSTGDRTRSFLKVQDGCDYSCSYCTIPLARGASRSGSIGSIVETAKGIASGGVREIVLTGVNIGSYRTRSGESFLDLLQALDEVRGLDRIRISSIEPNLLTDDMVMFVSQSKKFVPHFHIPLQSGSNKILRLMRRRYGREFYARRVKKIKELMPDCCIGVDVIVGFPGESEEDFLDTTRFIADLDVSYLHVFSYSERPNTDALGLERTVSGDQKAMRRHMLHILSEKKRRYFYDQHIGKSVPVLFETFRDGYLPGLTENYVRVRVTGPGNLWNRIALVKLVKNRGEYVHGELLN